MCLWFYLHCLFAVFLSSKVVQTISTWFCTNCPSNCTFLPSWTTPWSVFFMLFLNVNFWYVSPDKTWLRFCSLSLSPCCTISPQLFHVWSKVAQKTGCPSTLLCFLLNRISIHKPKWRFWIIFCCIVWRCEYLRRCRPIEKIMFCAAHIYLSHHCRSKLSVNPVFYCQQRRDKTPDRIFFLLLQSNIVCCFCAPC